MISPPQPSVCSQLSHNLFICLGGFIKCCSTYPYRTFNRYKTFYLKKFGLQSSSVPIVVMCLNHGFRNILNQKLRQNILLWLVNGLCKKWHLEFPTSHWLTIVLSYLHHQYIFQKNVKQQVFSIMECLDHVGSTQYSILNRDFTIKEKVILLEKNDLQYREFHFCCI